jgi:threonine/homoserine/homoserine lactone efflux protein
MQHSGHPGPVPTHVPAFIVTAFLLAMVPGAGQALMLRQVLTQGRPAAWRSIAGTCTGLLVWSTAAAAGLSAVLLANPAAYTAVRLVGGVILAYLGISSLRTMRAGHHHPSEPAGPDDGPRGAYLAGLATNLGNPKAGVFAISLIPQFVAPGGQVFVSSALLGLVWALTTASWYLVFVQAVDRARALVTRPTVTTWLHATTGVVLLGLGAGVVLAP